MEKKEKIEKQLSVKNPEASEGSSKPKLPEVLVQIGSDCSAMAIEGCGCIVVIKGNPVFVPQAHIVVNDGIAKLTSKRNHQ